MMKNIILITKREYLTQVKKKSFVILTLLAPLLLIGFGAVMYFLMNANNEQLKVFVGDDTGKFAPYLKSDKEVSYQITNYQNALNISKKLGEAKEDEAVLLIPKFEGDYETLQKNTQLLTGRKTGFELKNKIEDDLTAGMHAMKLADLNIPQSQWKTLDEKYSFTTKNVVEDKEEDNLGTGVQYAFSMLLMYTVFMFILMYGVRVMRSVLEEKNNRVVEIIISSVKPFELMLGKIIGVTLVALTQFSVWILMTGVGSLLLSSYFGKMRMPVNAAQAGAPQVTNEDFTRIAGEISTALLDMNIPMIIIVFILFFLMGYIFYSSMYAAIGSAVDNETETQQFSLFTILPLMVGMYGSFSLVNNPNSDFAFWLSMIPFTSPVAMVARIPFGVPLWQVALSFGILVLFTYMMVMLAGKIYRVGILSYGNKASFKDLWKWMRQ